MGEKINSKDDDYAPAYADRTHNSIMFTSDRELLPARILMTGQGSVSQIFSLPVKTVKAIGAYLFLLMHLKCLILRQMTGLQSSTAALRLYILPAAGPSPRRKTAVQS